jgi:hypothetical protein
MQSFRNNIVKLNFREPQSLNKRKIFSSYPIQKPDVKKTLALKEKTTNAANVQSFSAYLFSALALVCVFAKSS